MSKKKLSYKQAKALLAGGYLTAMLTSSILLGRSMKYVFDAVEASPDKTLGETLTSSGIVDIANHYEKVKLEGDSLYQSLRNGEISASEFLKRYEEINSSEYLEEWARTSNNPDIQNIISKFDSQAAQSEEVGAKAVSNLIACIGVAGSAEIAHICLKDHLRRKYKYPTKFTPLPDPNGEPPCKEENLNLEQ